MVLTCQIGLFLFLPIIVSIHAGATTGSPDFPYLPPRHFILYHVFKDTKYNKIIEEKLEDEEEHIFTNPDSETFRRVFKITKKSMMGGGSWGK